MPESWCRQVPCLPRLHKDGNRAPAHSGSVSALTPGWNQPPACHPSTRRGPTAGATFTAPEAEALRARCHAGVLGGGEEYSSGVTSHHVATSTGRGTRLLDNAGQPTPAKPAWCWPSPPFAPAHPSYRSRLWPRLAVACRGEGPGVRTDGPAHSQSPS